MSKPKNTVYMHTINGKPAFYDPKEKLLFYAGNGQASVNGSRKIFVETLRQVRKEQSADTATMVKNGLASDYKGKIDYLRIRIN